MNVGERRATASAPREAAVLAAVLDSIACGVLLTGPGGEVRTFNRRLLEILPVAAEELREMGDLSRLIPRLAAPFADPGAVEARWRETYAGDEACQDEWQVAWPERRVIGRFARPLLGRGRQRLGWLEVYRDLTGQHLMETQLLHAERMAALGRLVSGVVHELNNPLTSILGYSQLLLGRTSGPERDDALRILQEAERASRIAKNLLLFAREHRPERSCVDVNDIVERTLALRRYEWALEKIRVELHLASDLPAVFGDASQLQQVLVNLIVNAEQAIQLRGGPGTDLCAHVAGRRRRGRD